MNASISANDFMSYSNVLHISSVIVLCIGLFTLYLTIFHSTKDMGSYKYYIFNFQLAATLFDLHLSFVFSPMVILPLPATCSTSVFFIKSHWIYGYINFILMHYTLSYVGVSILIGLIYRYCALKGNLNFFHSKRGVFCIALGNILYPTPVVIALLLTHSNHDHTLQYVKTKFPAYYDFFEHNCCHGLSEPSGLVVYALVAAIQIVIVAACSITAIFKIIFLLKEKKIKLSKKTYDLHRQLIYSLGVQAFLPTCFLAMPTVAGFISIMNAYDNSKIFSLMIFPILCIHSAVLGLATIVMTKPYWGATIQILRLPFKKFHGKTVYLNETRQTYLEQTTRTWN